MKRIIPLNEKQIALVEDNISVIKTVICSRIIIDKNIFGMEYDDLYQEGCLLLCNAALMYDESRGSSFGSFAYIVILNGLISYCKKVENNRKNRAEYIESLKRQPESFSLQNSIPYERMVETNIIDFLDNIKAQYSGTVRLGIEALSLKVKGLSGGEIARLYGVKTNLVGAWISRALKKLKQNSVFNSYFNLVVALSNGRPCEKRIIEKEFLLLKEKAGLPNVVFHSLRHSSTTYKLKLNHGDLKATQGDTGHAEIDMITKVYAHILDEDRKINAQKFESAFYSNPDLRKVAPPPEESQSQTVDLAALIEQLQKSPELANTLASIIAGQKAC